MSDYGRVKGLKVMSIEEGVRCGKVDDLLVDYKSYKVFGFIVKGGWNKDAEIVLLKDITSFGPDVLMVNNSKSVRPAAKVPEALKAINDHVAITKLEVITRTGHVMGKIGTFEFDPSTGKIQQFEIAGSMLKSIFEGKHVIPIKMIISIGRDAMIVHEKGDKTAPAKTEKKEAPKKAEADAGENKEDAASSASSRKKTASSSASAKKKAAKKKSARKKTAAKKN